MRRVLIAVAKIAVAAALIVYVVASGKIDFRNLTRLIAEPRFFLGALAALTLQTVVVALRLKQLLKAHGQAPSLWTIVKLTYIGAFFDLVAVTSVGGDAVKAFYLAHEIPLGRRTESVSALVVDRLLGLLGLLSLTVAAAVWSLSTLWADEGLRPYLTGLSVVCAALFIATFLLFSRRLQEWEALRRLLQKLPFGHTVNRAYSSMRAFRDQPLILFEGWLLSMLVHLLGCAAGYFLASGLALHGIAPESGAPTPLQPSLFFAALMMSNFVSSFAPFGAIGVGQAAYAFVFEHVARLSGGGDLATALQVAFFLVKAPGFIAWVLAKRRSGTPEHVNVV